MWAYIIAATRGDSRHSIQKRDATANAADDHLYTYRDGKVFAVSTAPRATPGPSGLNTRETSCSSRYYANQSLPQTSSALNVQNEYRNQMEEGIEPFEEATTEANTGANWFQRHLARLTRNLRCRISGERRVKPPDAFLDKYSAQTFNDPQEPLYQAKRSKLLCGLKLAFDPTIPAHYHWLAVVSLAILYNVVFVIGRAVFWELDNLTPMWFVLDYLCDTIYLIDTVVHVHEGYLEQGLMVKDSKKLRQHYLESDSWRYDVISMLPTDIAYYWWKPGSCDYNRLPCPVIVRLNRLFRMPRMWVWFDRTETATSYPNAFRICKVVMAILVLIHWNACIYFVISYAIGFGTDNWVYNITGTRNESLAHQYIYSFYWSTLTLTTIGETPQPEIDAEYLFVVADFLAGVLIFATIVGNIGSMISNMNVARVEFQNKMDGVKQYMAFRKVSGELEARVIRWFAYTWAQSGALDEENVLSSLPDKLKAEIAIRVHMDTLKQVKIFQNCEPGLLEALVLKLRLQVFSPGDYICRKGDVGKEMYIVKRGRLQVVADDGRTVLATLSAGSVFGEVSVLEIAGNVTGNRRTANVRALGYSDLFCLAKRDLWEALADYPDARVTLTEVGCGLLRKDGLLDENIFKNAQTTQMSLEETVQKLETTVEMLNNRLQGLLTDVGEDQAKIKQRINKIEVRVLENEDDNTDSDDITSMEASELRSEIARTCDVSGYSEIPMSSTHDTSLFLLSNPIPIRERGHSLSVERTTELLKFAPEPRSKSLRLKRVPKDLK
ncbi:cyclic nucleotide-gated cation channel subunit A-like isoform X4 [Plodia interpunctella]|uniref:cyclic nucleotide-gated cation channel subunit A-like isoform X4 n=1 Tax=Plodia interpunctella TaxID=58824 RepID=UPI00236867A4|nr:cyclic nucleotide-gated cation channel subunit A-like isoform X4 [Plodia interpunctella]